MVEHMAAYNNYLPSSILLGKDRVKNCEKSKVQRMQQISAERV